MSILKSVMVSEKVVEVPYDAIPEFKIKLAYLSREELSKIRDECVTRKYNRRSREYEESVNDDKFLKLYSEKIIRDWSGLKMKHLPKLMPVKLTTSKLEEEVPYDKEDALLLLKNSTDFDLFITDTLANIETFEEQLKEEEEKN